MTKRATDQGTILNEAPAADDWALAVRPIGGAGADGEVIAQPTTGAVTEVTAALVSTTLLAANASRAGFSVRNNSAGAMLYIRANTAGGAATAINATVMLFPNAYYEDPYNFVGDVLGIWGPGIGVGDSAIVTEYVPVP